MITGIALAVFVVSAAVTVYIYLGYPLLLLVMARLRPRPVARAEVTPTLTMIVPVYNEAAVIAAKLANCLAVEYPPERLEVLVVSDGSTDDTEALVREADDPRVRLLVLPRAGKAAALNAGAAAARGEVLLFTDANVELAPSAPRVLAHAFADPEVGGVSGRKVGIVRRGADATERGENLYWRWDQWQKQLESTIGSIFAADGTLYAIRRELYVPISDPAQADDIAITTRVVLQGRRLLFDPEAVAYEEVPFEGALELRRKVRVTNHSVRALLNLGSALWRSGFYSVELLSHKLVRHLVPFFLLALLAASAVLAPVFPLFVLALAAQLGCYALAAAGFLLRHHRVGRLKLLSVPFYFCLVNLAALLGVIGIMRGRRVREWAPRGT